MSHQTCSTHPNQHLSLVCAHKDCKLSICPNCLLQHCKDHEKKKTFPDIIPTEAFRHELCNHISDILKTLNQEVDDLRISARDKIVRSLDEAEDEVINLVKEYFKEKKKQALDELQALQENLPLDSTLEVSSKLQEKIFEYEKLKSSISHSHVDVKILEALGKRQFNDELNETLEQVNPQTHPIRLWKADDIQSKIRNMLNEGFGTFKTFNFITFPSHLRLDFEAIPGDLTIIRKKGTLSFTTDCLGAILTKGIHSFSTRIDYLEQLPTGGNNGWLCMGVISAEYLPTLNLGTNNYYSSISICSDGNTYGLTMSQGGQVAVGATYDFEVNLETGVIKVTGPDGYAGQAEGHQGKSFLPYFEFYGKHQVSIFNYKRIK